MFQKTFSIDKDEIVRGEYFSHSKEPSITFNTARNLLYINAASLKRLPLMEYALLVISSSEKRLSIFPCETGERDAVRLRSEGKYRDKPRHVHCHKDFADKLVSLMKWKHDCRYRMIGYAATDGCNEIIAFDLSSAEVFSSRERIVEIPSQQGIGFGSAFEEQRNNPLIRVVENDVQIHNSKGASENET